MGGVIECPPDTALLSFGWKDHESQSHTCLSEFTSSECQTRMTSMVYKNRQQQASLKWNLHEASVIWVFIEDPVQTMTTNKHPFISFWWHCDNNSNLHSLVSWIPLLQDSKKCVSNVLFFLSLCLIPFCCHRCDRKKKGLQQQITHDYFLFASLYLSEHYSPISCHDDNHKNAMLIHQKSNFLEAMSPVIVSKVVSSLDKHPSTFSIKRLFRWCSWILFACFLLPLMFLSVVF